MIGAALYAAVYPKLERNVLHIGEFGDKTLIDVLGIGNARLVIVPVAALMIGFLFVLGKSGLVDVEEELAREPQTFYRALAELTQRFAVVEAAEEK